MLLAPLARLAPRVAAAAGRSISTAAPAAKAAPFAAKAVGWTAVGVVGAAVADKMRSEEVTEGSTSLTSSVVSAVSSLLSRSPVLLDTAGPNPGGVTFDSYMIPDADLEEGQLRLLEVDARVILPVETHIRFVISSTDVIHDWAVPSLGIKLDAIPGRLNQTSTLIERKGVFYGQCSELCGVYHGFMPIVVEAVDVPEYLAWILAEAA